MTRFAAVLCATLAVATSAVAEPAYKAPRTPWGHPDLQGVWNTSFILPFEARDDTPSLTLPEMEAKALARKVADEFAAMAVNLIDSEVTTMFYASADKGLAIVRGQRRTRQIVEPADGKLPLTPRARGEVRAIENSIAHDPDPRLFADNPEQRPSWERCLAMQGDPPITVLNDPNPRNIVQTRDHIVIHTEYGDEARIIPFADRHGPPPPAPQPPLGDAIAHWEGETLVIETIRLPRVDRIRIGPVMLVPTTATVIERYTRIAKGELLYQYTVIDPTVYAGPWLAEYSLYPQARPMYEFACHEGNYSLANILAGARAAERARAKAN